MKKEKTRSLLTVIQFFALIQICIGFIVLPAIWESGRSSIETHIQMGGENSVTAFRNWFESNLQFTKWIVVGMAFVTFLVAGVATFILCRNKNIFSGDSNKSEQKY